MTDYWWIVLVGLAGGVAVGVQPVIVGAMGQRVGGTAGSFIVHMSGMLASGLLLGLRGGEQIRNWAGLPWYMLGSGVFGLILSLTINVTLPRLGSAMMIALVVTGQLLAGMVIDHFGWLGVAVHPITPLRVLGLAALLVGGYCVSR
jgi:bacterial/archaeal transporter family-2 protein